MVNFGDWRTNHSGAVVVRAKVFGSILNIYKITFLESEVLTNFTHKQKFIHIQLRDVYNKNNKT